MPSNYTLLGIFTVKTTTSFSELTIQVFVLASYGAL